MLFLFLVILTLLILWFVAVNVPYYNLLSNLLLLTTYLPCKALKAYLCSRPHPVFLKIHFFSNIIAHNLVLLSTGKGISLPVTQNNYFEKYNPAWPVSLLGYNLSGLKYSTGLEIKLENTTLRLRP
jgi:hypothetical protein